MKIELQEITVRELTDGYSDEGENGVRGYGGRLDIRPPYQREFIYKDEQRNAVIDTICRGFPLNVMYWARREDGTFEVIDGQQRSISVCQYVKGYFSVKIDGDLLYFHNLRADRRDEILGYKLMVYVCEGTDTEKLDWFRTINIAGEKLTPQELRNAVYAGPWVNDAKRYFSRRGCAAVQISEGYVGGIAIRQELLETALKWICNGGEVEAYMSVHQHDPVATALWSYFQSVVTWVGATFTTKRPKIMKGVDWGALYNAYKDSVLDPKVLEERTKALLLDDDVTNQKGIFPYLLTGKEKWLNIRAFTDKQKMEAYERQAGVCAVCGKHFELDEMEADHITPWHAGGRTVAENCQMLCRECNRRKSGK